MRVLSLIEFSEVIGGDAAQAPISIGPQTAESTRTCTPPPPPPYSGTTTVSLGPFSYSPSPESAQMAAQRKAAEEAAARAAAEAAARAAAEAAAR